MSLMEEFLAWSQSPVSGLFSGSDVTEGDAPSDTWHQRHSSIFIVFLQGENIFEVATIQMHQLFFLGGLIVSLTF